MTLADLGALCSGAVVAPIDHSDLAEECRYILEHAGSRAVFCEDAVQLAKVAAVRERCPQLEHVITFDGSGPDAISLEELRRRGRRVDPAELDPIVAAVKPVDVATIVYTSGTTGPPKGCITTHANLMQTTGMYEQRSDLGPASVVSCSCPWRICSPGSRRWSCSTWGDDRVLARRPNRAAGTAFAACGRPTCRPFPACWRRSTRPR